jgi:hypothetical protein
MDPGTVQGYLFLWWSLSSSLCIASVNAQI